MSFKFNLSASGVVNSISEKEKKHTEKFFMTHQNNLIQSVENNLTIILVQEWRFFVESEQSYRFFRFSTKCVVLKCQDEL